MQSHARTPPAHCTAKGAGAPTASHTRASNGPSPTDAAARWHHQPTMPLHYGKTYRLHHLRVKGVGGHVHGLGRGRHGHAAGSHPTRGAAHGWRAGPECPRCTNRSGSGRPRAPWSRDGRHKGGHRAAQQGRRRGGGRGRRRCGQEAGGGGEREEDAAGAEDDRVGECVGLGGRTDGNVKQGFQQTRPMELGESRAAPSTVARSNGVR